MKIKLAILVLCVANVVSAFAGSDDCLVPGDNLVMEGVPKIPMQLADEVGRYTEFRFASN